MEKRYKKLSGQYITEKEATQLTDYSIEHWINGKRKWVDRIMRNQLISADYYLDAGETHKSVLASDFGSYKTISIIELEIFGEYNLEKGSFYENGILIALTNRLFDQNYEMVGTEWVDDLIEKVPEFDVSAKLYFDREVNPDRELFEVRFNEDGSLFEIDYNNFHIHPDGQESIVFDDSPEDIAELRELTGISENLANWYVSNRVPPTTDLP
ncbi:MAG: hypothetical protein MI810_07650 [Flavobacteriales bacterium]|nr:hypothetical protein [Flavobacteriales bacterium]